MNRRQFLAATTALVAVAAEDKKPMTETIPIVDTHQHLWDLTKFKLPWLQKGSHLDRSFVMSDYLQATHGLHVVKTVYMEVDVMVEQQPAEAAYVIDLCKRADNPMAAAVISGRPASASFGKYLDAYQNSAYVKGVRQVLHVPSTPAGYCLDNQFMAGVKLLGERGLSFDLCMRPTDLLDAAKLLDACPGTRFILDHCGNGDVQSKDLTQWKRDIAEVAKRNNVVCKVSGIVVNATPGKWTADELAPVVKHTLSVFGPDRVLFGGDWPVCTKAATYKQWVEALKTIVKDRPVGEQRKLFHDNAVAFYGLA